MRLLASKVKEIVERSVEDYEPFAIIFNAPTGYGKSVLSPRIYELVKSSDYAASLLHVMPTRSLVEDFYMKTLEREEKLADELYYQYMGIMISKKMREKAGRERKRPTFEPGFIVTTFDSFVNNFFGNYLHDYGRRSPRMAIAWERIRVSVVFLDEVHIYYGDETWPALQASLKMMSFYGIPLILATATLPQLHLKWMLDSVKAFRKTSGTKIAVVAYSNKWLEKWLKKRRGKEEDGVEWIVERDEDYEEQMDIDWKIKRIEGGNWIDKVVEIFAEAEREGKRVLAVFNKVERAVAVWEAVKRRLGEDSVELLTGRMTAWERGERQERLEGRHLVATQVAEVGLDESYDVLVTDLAPLANIVQRAGRVLRHGKEDGEEAVVYVVVPEGERWYKPYLKDEMEVTLKVLSEKFGERNADLRLPVSLRGKISLLDYQDEVYAEQKGETERRVLKASWLETIARNPDWTSYDIEYFTQAVGSIARDLPLVSFVIADSEKDLENMREEDLLAKNVIAASPFLLERLWKEEGRVKILYARFEKIGDEYVARDVEFLKIRMEDNIIKNIRSIVKKLRSRIDGKRAIGIQLPKSLYEKYWRGEL